jgi:hypothetical protein
MLCALSARPATSVARAPGSSARRPAVVGASRSSTAEASSPCRHCYQLAYASAREDISDRAARRADKLRARLGWKPGILNLNGGKPKWMRWRTFEPLAAEHDLFVVRSLRAAALKFRLLVRNFRD